VETVKVRRPGRLVSVVVVVLGMVAWQAGVGLAGETDPTGETSTTTETLGSDPGAPSSSETPATDAPAAPAEVTALAGPVGYTNGAELTGVGILCDFFEIDLPTGVLTQKTVDPEPCADGFTFSPGGTLYAYRLPERQGAGGQSELVTVDTATGLQTVVGDLPSVSEGGMTFDGAGNLWLYAANGGPECEFNFCLYKVDPATAATTLVGGQDTRFVGGLTATCTEVQAVSEEISGGSSNSPDLVRVNTTNAELSPIVSLQGEVGLATGLDYDATTQLWGVGSEVLSGFGNPISFHADPVTGATTIAEATLEGDPFQGPIIGLAVAGVSCLQLQPTFTG
jgi:hypothetical protein